MRGLLVAVIVLSGLAIDRLTPPNAKPLFIRKEPLPGFLQDGKSHDPGVCGWNGDLGKDGSCHVRIVFPDSYAPVYCSPESHHESGVQVIDCVWEPNKEKR